MSYTPAQKKAYAAKMQRNRDADRFESSTAVAPKRKAAKAPKSSSSSSYMKDFGSQAGGAIASAIEAYLNPLSLAKNAASLMGLGKYTPHGLNIKKNSIGEGNDPPEIHNAKDGRVIIRHREYLQDIITASSNPTDFTLTSFRLNPGLPDVFPWLSDVAQNFEEYRIRGMVFEFKSNYSEYNGTTPGLGTVIMATEYDSNRDLFVSKMQMENHQYASSCKPSSSMLHPIECAFGTSPVSTLYVRTNSVSDKNESRLYDYGIFQIATQGIPTASSNLGELWCTYEIELLKPQLQQIGGLQLSSVYSNTTGIASGTPFGSVSTLKKNSSNDFDITFDNPTSTFFYIPAELGECVLLIGYRMEGTGGAAITQASLTAVSNAVTGETTNDPFGNNMLAPATGITASSLLRFWIVRLTGQGVAKLQISGPTLVTPTSMFLFATTIQPGLGFNNFVTYTPSPSPAPLALTQGGDEDEDDDPLIALVLALAKDRKNKKSTPKVELIVEEKLSESVPAVADVPTPTSTTPTPTSTDDVVKAKYIDELDLLSKLKAGEITAKEYIDLLVSIKRSTS
jgi:hypothetical protein